jgi:hypothetical protein
MVFVGNTFDEMKKCHDMILTIAPGSADHHEPFLIVQQMERFPRLTRTDGDLRETEPE